LNSSYQINMSSEDTLESMKQEALEMGKYYYKGFGNTFQGILTNAESYLIKPERPERGELSAASYQWLDRIDIHYQRIPFNELHGRGRFYPLFIVQRLLPKFRETMDEAFKEQKRNALTNLITDGKSIVNVGRLYKDSFEELLKEIRSYPESSDFRIKIVDSKNQVWYF